MKLKRLCRYCVIKVWMCFGSFLKQLPLLCLPGTALSAEELKDFQSLRILLQAAPSEPCLDPPLGKTPLEPGPSESPSSFSASSNPVFFKAVSTLQFKCKFMNLFFKAYLFNVLSSLFGFSSPPELALHLSTISTVASSAVLHFKNPDNILRMKTSGI